MNIELLNDFNKELSKYNIPELSLISPAECIGQKINARYFEPQIFKQLVENIKKDGNLQSIPLVYLEDNIYYIISGHHRIAASVEANIEKILVFCISPQNKDEIISKQLSHNSLVGKDDPLILKELFEAIKQIEFKIATGLSSEISSVQYTSLNFKIGDAKELVITFLPKQIENYDIAMEKIAAELNCKSSSSVRLTDIEYYDKFTEAIRKVKKIENIKSNGTAILRLTELALEKIAENKLRDKSQTEKG